MTPDPDCKYAPDCFSDSHHVYGRPPSGIARRFAMPEVEQLCRAEHDNIHHTIGVEDLPSLQTMKGIIDERKRK